MMYSSPFNLNILSHVGALLKVEMRDDAGRLSLTPGHFGLLST